MGDFVLSPSLIWASAKAFNTHWAFW